jgi:hypothetical protein
MQSTAAPIFVCLDAILLEDAPRLVRCLAEASNKYGLAFLLPADFQPLCARLAAPNIFVLGEVSTGKYRPSEEN